MILWDCLNNGVLVLEFLIDEPKSPASVGLSDDTRMLGLGLSNSRENHFLTIGGGV